MNERVGEIEGVRFDLTHPALDPISWGAPDLWYIYGVSFPWDRILHHGAELDDEEIEESPVVVAAGDAITIRAVSRLSHDRSPVADLHDAEERWAELLITKQDGSTAIPSSPIVFVAHDAMGPHSPHREYGTDGYDDYIGAFRTTFQKIGLRIARLKLANPPAVDGEWLNFAGDMFDEACGEIEHWEPGELAPGETPNQRFELLLDAAAAAGYALARAEAELRLKPIAKEVVATRQGRARTASARRALADPIREAALTYIAANPKTTQGACAAHVVAVVRKSDRHVQRILMPMFEWRDLPGGAREKRPKPELLSDDR